MPKNLEDLISEFTSWGKTSYPEATPRSCLKKCKEEIREIEKAFDNIDFTPEHELVEEFVDAIMCLLHGACLAGFDTETIRASFSRKLLINKRRTWIKNGDNTYSHKKL